MMKKTLIIEYDDVELFDAVAKVGDGGVAIGTRLAQSLLAPPNFSTEMGLGFYGISIKKQEESTPNAKEV